MNRSAKGGIRSSSHHRGEGVLIHPPYQGDCGRHCREHPGTATGPSGCGKLLAHHAQQSELEGQVLWKQFQQIKEWFPLVRPKLYLPYSELQAIAVL
jgi:hypothetical protein